MTETEHSCHKLVYQVFDILHGLRQEMRLPSRSRLPVDGQNLLMITVDFAYPDTIQSRYTDGDCLELAIALHQKLNAPMYGLFEYSAADPTHRTMQEPFHYVVRYGDAYVDVCGVWSQQALIKHWTTLQVELSTFNSAFMYKLELVEVDGCGIDLETHNIADDIVRKLSELHHD